MSARCDLSEVYHLWKKRHTGNQGVASPEITLPTPKAARCVPPEYPATRRPAATLDNQVQKEPLMEARGIIDGHAALPRQVQRPTTGGPLMPSSPLQSSASGTREGQTIGLDGAEPLGIDFRDVWDMYCQVAQLLDLAVV